MNVDELVEKRNKKFKKMLLLFVPIIFVIVKAMLTDTNVLKNVLDNIILFVLILFLAYYIGIITVEKEINKLRKNGEIEKINLELESNSEKNYIGENVIITDNYLIYCGIKFFIVNINNIIRLYTYHTRGRLVTAIELNNKKEYYMRDYEGKVYKNLIQMVKNKELKIKIGPGGFMVLLYLLSCIIIIIALYIIFWDI